jgi:hypothetical protein
MRLNNIVGITDRSKAGLLLIGEPGAGKKRGRQLSRSTSSEAS